MAHWKDKYEWWTGKGVEGSGRQPTLRYYFSSYCTVWGKSRRTAFLLWWSRFLLLSEGADRGLRTICPETQRRFRSRARFRAGRQTSGRSLRGQRTLDRESQQLTIWRAGPTRADLSGKTHVFIQRHKGSSRRHTSSWCGRYCTATGQVSSGGNASSLATAPAAGGNSCTLVFLSL